MYLNLCSSCLPGERFVRYLPMRKLKTSDGERIENFTAMTDGDVLGYLQNVSCIPRTAEKALMDRINKMQNSAYDDAMRLFLRLTDHTYAKATRITF